MIIEFDNIFQHVIPMGDFQLKWRFTEEKYDKLPKQHLDHFIGIHFPLFLEFSPTSLVKAN